MNGIKLSKKYDATKTGAPMLTLYRHHFSEAELYSINTARFQQ